MKTAVIILGCLVTGTAALWGLLRFQAASHPVLVPGKTAPQASGTQHDGAAAQTPPLKSLDHPTPPEFKIPHDPLLVAVGDQSSEGSLMLIGVLAPDVPAENAASPDANENAASYYFATTHFRPGTRYNVYRGGSAVGEAVVTSLAQRQCDARGAMASVEPKINLGRDGFALATNSPQVGTHTDHQRVPTETERSAALRTVRKIFSEKGVLPEDLQKTEARSLVATIVDRDGNRILIGWFQVMTPIAGHKLFVILGGTEDALESQYAQYETVLRKDMVAEWEEWPDRPPQIFVDQLDLDGDGVDELVTESVGYEGGDFIIYKRQNHQWFEVFRGGEGGC